MERTKKYHKKSEYEIWNLSKLAKKKLLFCFVLQLHFEPLRGFRPICELLLVWFCSLGLDGADRTSMDAESRLPRLSRLPANKYDICVCVFFFDLIFEYFFKNLAKILRMCKIYDWEFWLTEFWYFGLDFGYLVWVCGFKGRYWWCWFICIVVFVWLYIVLNSFFLEFLKHHDWNWILNTAKNRKKNNGMQFKIILTERGKKCI